MQDTKYSPEKTNKKIVVVGRREDRDGYDTPQSMAFELTKVSSDVQYGYANLEELLFAYDGVELRVLDGQNKNLAIHDAVFLMGWFKTKMHEDEALAVTMYARAHNMPFLNSEAGGARSCSKLSQSVAAALNGVQTMPFVFAQDNSRLLEGVDNLKLTYPLILKSVRASKGNDNYLVKSRKELESLLAEFPEVAFIAQAFIPNDGDYRIIVMGDQVRFVMHRLSSSESHLHNTSKGGVATEIAIDSIAPTIIEQSITIAKVLNREITGVDMIVDKNTGEHYFLEANNMPQLSTGSLVEAKITKLDEFLANWISAE